MTFSFKPTAGNSKSNIPKKVVPWVEKYRPTKLEDVAAQEHTVTVLRKSLQSSNLPHMLFYGPPGTGKTSTILALCNELFGPKLARSRVLELNASDERGISIVREKVKNFARSMVSAPSEEDKARYPCPPYKLIIMDEADSMTGDAQAALRRTMETYASVTRFCLICNYVTRIIDPLASRCSKFRFKPLDESNALDRLTNVAKMENVQCEDGALIRLLEASGGDLRKAITFLQSASMLVAQGVHLENDDDDGMDIDSNVREPITIKTIDEISGTVPTDIINDLVKLSQENTDLNTRVKDIRRAVDNLIMDGWSGAQIVHQLHDRYLLDDLVNNGHKNTIAEILSEADKRLTDGSDEHLEVLNIIMQISKLLN